MLLTLPERRHQFEQSSRGPAALISLDLYPVRCPKRVRVASLKSAAIPAYLLIVDSNILCYVVTNQIISNADEPRY